MKYWSLLLALGLCLTACSSQPATPTPPLLPLPSRTPSPAVTVQETTPVVIATATFTPTPVVYVVQKGDTLVGIAVKYGISVEALQAANNNVQPEFLSIGAALLIPLSEDSPKIVISQPTSTPVPVELGPVACYPTATHGLYCFVAARNPHTAPVQNVSALITLADAEGIPLKSSLAYSAIEVLQPNEAAPLAILFPGVSAEVVVWRAQLLRAEPAANEAGRYVALEILTHSGTSQEGEWSVTGQVSNASAKNAASVRLTLTLYDSAGAILNYRQTVLAEGLASGATRDFSISAASLGGAVDHYTISAEGN
jgi:LysM repeat protein